MRIVSYAVRAVTVVTSAYALLIALTYTGYGLVYLANLVSRHAAGGPTSLWQVFFMNVLMWLGVLLVFLAPLAFIFLIGYYLYREMLDAFGEVETHTVTALGDPSATVTVRWTR